MLSEKSFCKAKALVNMLFGALSLVIFLVGLVAFFAALIVHFHSGLIGIQAAFGGIFVMWLGLFGLRTVLKDGCPMQNKSKQASAHIEIDNIKANSK